MSSSRPYLSIDVLWKRIWVLLRQRWGSLLAVLVLQVVVGVGINGFSDQVAEGLRPFFTTPLKVLSLSPLAALVPVLVEYMVSLLIFPITSLVQAYASVGAVKVFLDILRGEPFRWNRLLKHRFLEWAYMVALANVVFYATSIGFVLLFIPGLVMSLGFSLSGLVLIEKELDPIQALAESWAMMKGQKMFMMLNFILAGIAIVVGLIACLLGFIPAILATMLVCPVMYELLRPQSSQGASDPEHGVLIEEQPPEGIVEDDVDHLLEIDPDTDPGQDDPTEDVEPKQTS